MLSMFLLVVGFTMFHLRTNYYHPRWQFLALFASGYLSYLVALDSNFMFGTLFFYLLGSSVAWGMYSIWDRKLLPCDFENCRTAICVFSTGLLYIMLDSKIISDLFDVIPFVIMLSAILATIPLSWTISKTHLNIEGRPKACPIYGISANTSVSSTFISIITAIMLTHEYGYYLKEIAVILAGYTLLRHKGTAGILGYVASLSLWLLFIEQYVILLMLAFACFMIGISHWKYLSDPSGRLEIWKHLSAKLINRKFILQGLGNGTYKFAAPASGEIKAKKYGISVTNPYFAHNDFLQFVIDSGIIGVIILIGFFVSIFPNLGQSELIIIAAILPNAIFNFPFHMAPDVVFIIAALKRFFYEN